MNCTGSMPVVGLFFHLFFDDSSYLINCLGVSRRIGLSLCLGLTGMMMVSLLRYRHILSPEERLTHQVRENSLVDSEGSMATLGGISMLTCCIQSLSGLFIVKVLLSGHTILGEFMPQSFILQ